MRGGGSIGQGIEGAALCAGWAPMSAEQVEEARALKRRLRCSWAHLSQMTGRNAETLRALIGDDPPPPELAPPEPAPPRPVVIRRSAPPRPAPDPLRAARRVLAEVAAKHGLTVAEVVAYDRTPTRCAARHEALKRCCALRLPDGQPRYSFAALSPLFSGRSVFALKHCLTRGANARTPAPPLPMAKAERIVARVARAHGLTVAQMMAPGHGTWVAADARREALEAIRAITTPRPVRGRKGGRQLFAYQDLVGLFGGRSAPVLARMGRRGPRRADAVDDAAPSAPAALAAPPAPDAGRSRGDRYYQPRTREEVLARGAALVPLLGAAQRSGRGGTARAITGIAQAAGLTPNAVGWRLRALSLLSDPLVYRTGGRVACWRLTVAGWAVANAATADGGAA